MVNEMYELIEQFAVPTPPEDFAVYQVNLATCINITVKLLIP